MRDDLLSFLKEYNDIALFASLESEIDTFPLIDELLKQEKNVYLPKTNKNDIEFYKVTDLSTLKISKDKYKVREPSDGEVVSPSTFDIIICPGVCFDKNNNRLGHGKGYYDRYLSKRSIYKLGVCYKEQLVDELPIDGHHVKMDLVKAY